MLSVAQVLDNLFLINTTEAMFETFLTIVFGLLLGLIIALTYRLTTKRVVFSMEFALTIIVVCGVISLIIAVIGTNIARAFSLAGALSIIRFRSIQQAPRDIGFLFFAMGTGLACGAGLFMPALIFVLLMCVLMLVYSLIKSRDKRAVRLLKICVPDTMSIDGLFDDVLDKYSSGHSLRKVRLISGGSVLEVSYLVSLTDMSVIQPLFTDVRARNANFNVSVSYPADEVGE
ncbi:MAG: DUF4956 domain-containing protein [Eubacteriales bacterium]